MAEKLRKMRNSAFSGFVGRMVFPGILEQILPPKNAEISIPEAAPNPQKEA
jgi:hypothetical protein